MTRQKSFKGRIRARMDKTSESYTTARRQLLAKAGTEPPAEAETHPEIARWLVEEHGVGGWWAQGVTVGYEQARGLRDPGQRRGGLYEANASKTVAVPVERLYEAFADPAVRERWLPGAVFEVRTARPGRSIRANWDDGSTRLVVAFTARGEAKSQVALVHERIPDAATADKLKAWWRERVAVLKQVLEA
jgi:hypothetical protein